MKQGNDDGYDETAHAAAAQVDESKTNESTESRTSPRGPTSHYTPAPSNKALYGTIVSSSSSSSLSSAKLGKGAYPKFDNNVAWSDIELGNLLGSGESFFFSYVCG